MKKNLAFFAVLLAAMLPSCTNDDIEIINNSGFTLNISTQTVYDDFNITDDFKNRFLGGKGYSIGVYSFIYDKSGTLSASDSTYVDTFGRVSQVFNLKAGEYTLITLEMIVENGNNNSSPNWVIIDKDKLETIKIVNKDYTSYWYSAVGLYTSPISVGKGEMSMEIMPKGIGVIVDTRMTNFNNSDYVCVNYFTKDQPQGRLLSPSYQGEDRMVYDHYNESHTWTARGYSYDKSGLDEVEKPTIYLLEDGEVRYCFGAQELKADGSLDSSFFAFPSTYATFLARDGATYYGGFHYIGGTPGSDCEAGMFNSYSQYIDWYNQVLKETSNYAKPYLEWGASANAVDNYMKQLGLLYGESGLSEELGIYWVSYNNKVGSVFYEYQFNVNKDNLNVVFMNFDTKYYTIDQIRSDLSKSYEGGEYVEELKGYYFYSDRTVLLLDKDTSLGYIEVLYVPNSSRASTMRQIVGNSSNLKSYVKLRK